MGKEIVQKGNAQENQKGAEKGKEGAQSEVGAETCKTRDEGF